MNYNPGIKFAKIKRISGSMKCHSSRLYTFLRDKWESFRMAPIITNSDISIGSTIGRCSSVMGSTIDRHSYCGEGCIISNAEIGSFCSIARYVSIGLAEHPMAWASTSPVFQYSSFRRSPVRRLGNHTVPSAQRTVIGADVWIGERVFIKQGVHIGHGAVIGAGCVVTKDVPPYAVVVGVPGRIIKYRFPQETISLLLESEWWTLSDEQIHLLAPSVVDVERFAQEAREMHQKKLL